MSLRALMVVALMVGPMATAQAASSPAAVFPGIDSHDWNAPQKPLRVFGNTWYVGPHGLSALLVDTGQGLALFDGGLPESAPVIEANIRALGFRLHEVKWIFNSHAHADHAGGIAALARDSGAQVLASFGGAAAMALGGADRDDPQYGSAPAYPPVRGVRVVHDGQTVRLGNVAVTAHYTPGHTPGSTTWTWRSCERGDCYTMVYADSLTALGAPGFRFRAHAAYVARFRQSIATVAALPCDILLTPHPDASGFWQKVARRHGSADAGALVDAAACRAYAATATKHLDAKLAQERDEQ